jgi:hypothetical protein
MSRKQKIIDTEREISNLEFEVSTLEAKKYNLKLLKSNLVDLKNKRNMMDYYKIKDLDQEDPYRCIRVKWFFLGINWGYRVPNPTNAESVRYWQKIYEKRILRGAQEGYIDLKIEDFNDIENWNV